jgi:hypothetical protein
MFDKVTQLISLVDRKLNILNLLLLAPIHSIQPPGMIRSISQEIKAFMLYHS